MNTKKLPKNTGILPMLQIKHGDDTHDVIFLERIFHNFHDGIYPHKWICKVLFDKDFIPMLRWCDEYCTDITFDDYGILFSSTEDFATFKLRWA